MMFKIKSGKGFFFSLAAFLLLFYIAMSLGIWSKVISQYEKEYSEKFKTLNMELILENIQREDVQKFGEFALRYAMWKVNKHVAMGSPIKNGNDEEEIENVIAVYLSLIENGSADASYFSDNQPLAYDEKERRAFSFNGWFEVLNDTANGYGLILESGGVSDLSFHQLDINKFSISFNISFVLRDKKGRIRIVKDYEDITSEVDISGFLFDPMVARLAPKGNEDDPSSYVAKTMFFSKKTVSDLKPRKLYSSTGGQGFFYGPVVTEAFADGIEENDRPLFILAISYGNLHSVENWEDFGAFLFLEDTAGSGPDPSDIDVEQPFAVVNEDVLDRFPESNYKRDIYPHVLFISSISSEEGNENPDERSGADVSFYDIESLRSFAICNSYIHNPEAPSYLQRLLDNPFKSSEEFGIESLLIGTWAGGESDESNEGLSRIDWEFYNDKEGVKIKGMPGCKSEFMCSGEESPVGHFRLTEESAKRYFGNDEEIYDDLVCDSEECGE